jgi:hypothetical protein
MSEFTPSTITQAWKLLADSPIEEARQAADILYPIVSDELTTAFKAGMLIPASLTQKATPVVESVPVGESQPRPVPGAPAPVDVSRFQDALSLACSRKKMSRLAYLVSLGFKGAFSLRKLTDKKYRGKKITTQWAQYLAKHLGEHILC